MARRRPLQADPIAEAKRQWVEHGWGDAAQGMAMVTSIMRAQRLVLSRVETELKPFDLSFARFELLRLLAFTREGRMPMASVISRLQVHPASVTGAVDRLVRAGLVEREPHPEDGRATLLLLTSRGRELVEQATAVLNERVFASTGLDDADTSALVSSIARLRRAAGDFEDPHPHPEPL